jgi:branched-chain amino acid transport system ATP-binding protein
VTLLRVRNLEIRFGGIVALDGVSFDVAPREICGLIGPNGAGKTTLFNCISRLYRPGRGSIMLDGAPLDGVPRHRLAALGIARTFQNLALFPRMTVLDNIMIGTHARGRGGFVANALRLPVVRREEARARERALELAAELDLGEVLARRVSDLPLGTRKRVELARALAADPKLLLLDEPAAGLGHEDVAALMTLVRRLRDARGVAVLLVEHHMHVVMGICDRVVVLDFGRKIAEGTPREVQAHPEVVRAYLGAPACARAPTGRAGREPRLRVVSAGG